MEAALWNDYWEHGDETARERLLERHLGLVHHVALGIIRRAPAGAELDDLVSAGTVGLIEAVEKFEPQYGRAFSTFAQPRIHGAILDDLRRRDVLSRSQRRRRREIDRARERAGRRLGREPKDLEVAEEIGVPVEELWVWERTITQASAVSLDAESENEEGRTSMPADESIPSPDEGVLESERSEILRDAILELPDRERKVLSLYYLEEVKLKDIAEMLGVTVSRASQIRSRAVERLRERMSVLVGA